MHGKSETSSIATKRKRCEGASKARLALASTDASGIHARAATRSGAGKKSAGTIASDVQSRVFLGKNAPGDTLNSFHFFLHGLSDPRRDSGARFSTNMNFVAQTSLSAQGATHLRDRPSKALSHRQSEHGLLRNTPSPDTVYPVFQILSISSFQFHRKYSATYNLRYSDRNRGIQHNSNIAAEAMTVQDKHRPCQDGVFSHK